MGDFQNITKTDFLRYLETPRHLWAHKHNRITVGPSDFDQFLMNQGYQVEALARNYFQNYCANIKTEDTVSLQETFSDGAYSARIDALVHNSTTGTDEFFEIKSSSSLKTEFIPDAAFQYLVLNTYRSIQRVFILHLNKDYIRHGQLDIQALFTIEDITESVLDVLPEIRIQRENALHAIQSDSPGHLQGCYKPADCPCPDICHPNLPERSIFDIPRLSTRKKDKLRDQGIIDIEDVPQEFPLSAKQRLVVEVAQTNQEHIDLPALILEFQKFSYPLYFLDYETCLSAIPVFDHFHPQQHIVFQYSLHKLIQPDANLLHSDFISTVKSDPSQALLEQLHTSILDDNGTVFVWNKTFEMTRNKELALLQPDFAPFLENLNGRIYDLGNLINKGYYLHPAFKGSWSIKNVLPVMVPDLQYQGLDVEKGDQAMLAWYKLVFESSETTEKEKIKKSLLDYCELDTLAMVHIFQRLQSIMAAWIQVSSATVII